LPPPRRVGGSRAQCVQADDKAIYVVKFQQNDQGRKVLLNELIASRIAEYMGIPTPETALVYFGDTFLEANPKLKTLYDAPVCSGYHFGSKYFPKHFDSIPSLISTVTNVADFPAIIAFDVLTDNHDRCENHHDNVLLIPDSGGNMRLLAIDHGNCFGCFWSADTLLAKIGTWCRSYMPEMAIEVRGKAPFTPPSQLARTITESLLEDVIFTSPDEWWSSEEERDAIVQYVIGQAANVLPILCRNKELFPYWVTHA
jgi:hypothetical protein